MMTIEFLKNLMAIFRRMEVGHKKNWKPSQTGVLVSTESLLDCKRSCWKIEGTNVGNNGNIGRKSNCTHSSIGDCQG
jgi:hypothetical protein